MHVYDELLDRGLSGQIAGCLSDRLPIQVMGCHGVPSMLLEATGNFTNPSKTHQMVWTLKNCGRHADQHADYNLLHIGYLKQLDGNGSLDSHSCV